MLGLFSRKRKAIDGMARAVEVAAAFERLRRDAPGSAYIFARTLHNSRELIDNKTTLADKLSALDQEIQNAPSPNVDAGIQTLAFRFVRSLVLAERAMDLKRIGLSATFGGIAKHGLAYRDVQERDLKPPASENGRAALAKGGHASLAEAIAVIREEGNAKEADVSEYVATIIALYDLRDEAEEGRLSQHLDQLNAAIASLSS